MRKVRVLFLFVAVLFVGVASNITLAADTAKEITELKAFVDTGALYVKEHGAKEAYAEINKVNGKLRKGDLYLFVYNNKGVCLAHGDIPKERVGKNFYNEKDIQGTPIIKQLIKTAKAGGGFVKYYWLNSKTGKNEYKTSYVKPLENNILIGSGIYLPQQK